MRAVYELSDDAGTGRDAHLDHDEPQESLHSVRADVHSLRDFFTSEPVCQMQHRFDFAVGQLKARHEVKGHAVTFNRDCDGGFGTAV